MEHGLDISQHHDYHIYIIMTLRIVCKSLLEPGIYSIHPLFQSGNS